MAKPRSQPPRPPWRLSRFLQGRWRLLIATVLCILLVIFLPEGYRAVSRLLIAWDAGIALYLVLVLAMIVNSDAGRVRRESALQDEGRFVIPILTVIAAIASLAAIVFGCARLREAMQATHASSRSCSSPPCSPGCSST